MEIDADAREVRVDGERATLAGTEWRILELLLAGAGWIVPYDRIASRVWGRDGDEDLDSLRVFIRRLRIKLGDDAAEPRYIETVRGRGVSAPRRRSRLKPARCLCSRERATDRCGVSQAVGAGNARRHLPRSTGAVRPYILST